MKAPLPLLLLFATTAGTLVGCGEDATTPTDGATPVSIDRSRFVLGEEPDGAVGVIAAKDQAEDGAPLVLVGRIGGSERPWIDGRAAFTLIDASMNVVAEGEDSADEELCTGDCCATERLACTTLVKFVDAQGQIVPVDSRELLGVKENDMVVIQGKVRKDDTGNFSLLATGLYVRE